MPPPAILKSDDLRVEDTLGGHPGRRAGASTVISAISSPKMNRATSTSWTSESRTIISERNESGTVSFRWVLCSSSVRPNWPLSSSVFICAYSGSKRRMKPTCTRGCPALQLGLDEPQR